MARETGDSTSREYQTYAVERRLQQVAAVAASVFLDQAHQVSGR